jgi:hypothetical protein
MTGGIIPCLYNSFSFTLENIIGGDIVCYEIKNVRVTREELVVPSLPSVLPEPMFSKKCTADKNDDVSVIVTSDDDNESESDSDTSSLHSSSSSPSSSSPSSETETPVMVPVSQFNPDSMKQYAYITKTNSADTILSCAYVMLYGVEKYETIENQYVESNRFKFELIEVIRENKPRLKANKIKLSAVEESLVHKPFITLETLHAIAVCKSLSLCIVQDRKYFEITNGNDIGSDVFIIEKIKGKFVLYIAPKQTIINYLMYIRGNYWRMESISAPIRPISAYKLQDLIDISQKLNLPVVNVTPGKFGSMSSEKRKTKPELYEAICRCV